MRTYVWWFYVQVFVFLKGGKVIFGKKRLLLVIQNELLTRTAYEEESCINHTSFLRGSAAVALRALCMRLSTAFEASLNKLIFIRRQGSMGTFSNANVVQMLSELVAGKTDILRKRKSHFVIVQSLLSRAFSLNLKLLCSCVT